MSLVDLAPRIAGSPTHTTDALRLDCGDHVVDALGIKLSPFVGMKLVVFTRPLALCFSRGGGWMGVVG